MRRTPLAAVLMLALAPGAAHAQDGGAEESRERLEARQAARLQELGARRLLLAERAALRWRNAWGEGRPEAMGGYGYGHGWGDAYGSGDGYGWGGWDGGYDGYGWGDAYGSGGWGWRPVWVHPVPNPYRDWAGLWGRGWLDDAPVPPYHRFQYRFFPETLPDPTVGGYPTVPQGVAGYARAGAPRAGLPPRGARPGAGANAGVARCARIDLELVNGDATTVLVPLPTLGAVTPEALGAVVRDRLRRGTGVAVRDVDGYVFHFPSAPGIARLDLGGC